MSEAAKEKRLVLEVVGETRNAIELPRQGVLTIGSAQKKADVALDGQGVADVHCAIGRIKGGGWALKDLGSPSGTFVNGERVQQRRLEEGDVVFVGSRRLRVIDPEQVPTTPAAAAAAPPPPSPPKAAPSEPASPRVPSEAPPRMTISATQVAAQTLPQVRGYRVEKPLGRGGMGEVYLAVQESLDRRVALKVLSSKLSADADFVRRFQAEARAAAALSHPNVVTVHDVWEESGRHFLAMEFMDKGNLETRVAREGRLPSKEVIEILADASKALVYAEMRGIVHRDLKPANLMQNSVGTTKVADLGLATHLEAEATESDNKKIFGTPHFISPEQARGEKVDARSDLYSLGATVYRMLSGRTPFEGATTRDILRGHFFEQPKKLSELAPDAPPELARIVHRLLEKKPDDRFPSASALLQEVERLKSATVHGIHAPAPGKKKSTGTLIALGGAAVAALALLLFFFTGDKPNSTPSTTTSASNTRGNVKLPPKIPAGTSTTEPEPTPDATASNSPPKRPSDSDQALKLREREADRAYERLPADLPLDARRDELVRLSQDFAGTTAAGRFAEEAEKLRTELERSDTVLTEREQVRKQALDQLRKAGHVEDHGLPLNEALQAMLAAAIPAEVATDAVYLAQRKQVFTSVLRGALERGQAALARVEELENTGKFSEVASEIKPWLVSLSLPDSSSEPWMREAPEAGELDALRGRLSQHLDNLETARQSFSSRMLGADGARLSAALRGASGVEHDLRTLDLATADERLGQLEGELQTEETKEFVKGLREQVRAGKRSLDVVIAAFPTWRRKTVADPRSKARANRDAVSVGRDGVQVKIDEANSELVPWSAFADRPGELNQLFEKRLTREYTSEELAGIEALMRTAAVLQALDEATEMFIGEPQNVLTEEEAKSLVEGFEVGRVWANMLRQPAAMEREATAAKVLADGLRAASTGSWTLSVASLERLRSEFRSTLLVHLLSDGSAPATGAGQ